MNEVMLYFNSLPVPKLRITSHYGKRNTGIAGASTFHRGIDIGGSGGDTPIFAVRRGRVARNYWNDVRGWVVIIEHNKRYSTLYQHLKVKSHLQVGDYVEAGQQIGTMGNTSKTIKCGVHLHMELHDNGVPVDFEAWLRNVKGVEEDMTEKELKDLIRAEVKAVLVGNGKEPSPWAKTAWEEAIRKGITDGTKPQGYPTREQVVVMMSRDK